jgi:hypothetical protein
VGREFSLNSFAVSLVSFAVSLVSFAVSLVSFAVSLVSFAVSFCFAVRLVGHRKVQYTNIYTKLMLS